jgi:hypothetical protein
MAGTSLDMTAPRPHRGSPVYAVYGTPDPSTLSLAAMIAAGTTLVEVPFDMLAALETGCDTLRTGALARLHESRGKDYVGAVGFDDWWTTALEALNPRFPLSAPRRLVTEKHTLYRKLSRAGVPVADYQVGTLSTAFLNDAVTHLGPRPVLKPATGAGSRGVYRYRDDLTINDNLTLHQQLLSLGHIDSQIPIIAAEYLGCDIALEISADLIVCDSRTTHTVVHEKKSATHVHPFVDHVMVSPPTHAALVDTLPDLPDVLTRTVRALKSRPSVGFVGLETEAGTRCVCWSNGQIWLEDVGVDALPAVHELVPGWCVLGRPVQVCQRVDRAPGQTAVTVARRLQSSVIVGDTGRLGVGRLKIVGSGGAERIFTGLEAGSLRLDDTEAKVDRRRRTELGLGVVTLDESAVVAAQCVSI